MEDQNASAVYFDRKTYSYHFLFVVFGWEVIILGINIFYILCSIQQWAVRESYPIRMTGIMILLFMIATAFLCTVCEVHTLRRSTLFPGRLLKLEIIKATVVLPWAILTCLCIASILEHYEYLAVPTFAFILHLLSYFIMLSPLPYAALMYHRDRNGYFDERKFDNWKYENGQWIPPPTPEESEDDDRPDIVKV